MTALFYHPNTYTRKTSQI